MATSEAGHQKAAACEPVEGQLKIATTHESDGVAIVTVTGEVDVATTPQLREQLVRQPNERPRTLVIDL